MATETTHTRAQLQDDINTTRAHYHSSIRDINWFANVLDAAQRYCVTLPKVHHEKQWAVIDRSGCLRAIFATGPSARNFASSSNFVVCELTGSCEL